MSDLKKINTALFILEMSNDSFHFANVWHYQTTEKKLPGNKN